MHQATLKEIEKSYLAQVISNSLLEIIEKDMENDNSFFLNVREGFIPQIADKIVNNYDKPIVIGVTGESASGKTTLALKALNACCREANCGVYTLISGDDYYYDSSDKLKEVGSYLNLLKSGVSFDSPDSVDLDKMKEDIIDLSRGKNVLCAEYNFATCKSIPDQKLKNPAKVILTEGIFALNQKLRDVLDVAVYVHTPFHVIEDRWHKRVAQRGTPPSAVDTLFNDVITKAEKHIRPTKDTADIVVSGLISSEYIQYLAEQFIVAAKKAITGPSLQFISRPKQPVLNK